jgi:hypothetical protein
VPFCSRAPEDDVLKPIVARYQGKVSRIYFRADAAFAMPEVYEFLEAERIKYAIRLPATLSPRRLHRDEHEPPDRARRCFLQQARDVRAMDQGGQRRDQVDATVVPNVRRQRGAAPASCAPTEGVRPNAKENGQIKPSTKSSGYPRCW